MDFIFIDTGLLEHILKDDNAYNNFKLSVYDNCDIQKRVLPTSFSVLEYIGLRINTIPALGNQNYLSLITKMETAYREKTPEEFVNVGRLYLEKLIKDYQKIIDENDNFGIKNIKELTKNNLGHKPQNMRDEWKIFLPLDINSQKCGEIRKAISLDRCLAHYPQNLKGEVEEIYNILLLSEMADFIREGHIVPFARLINKIDRLPLVKQYYAQDFFSELIKKARFGNKKDLVDTELIHYSIVGYFHEGKYHPVHCYTCDDKSQIEARVQLYLILINTISKLSNEDGKEPLEHFISSKKIYICKNNEIIDLINIQDEQKKIQNNQIYT